MSDTDDHSTDTELTGRTDSIAGSLDANSGNPDETRQLRLPPDATADEAAAITSVVAAHLADQAAAAASVDPNPTWDGDKWQFAGRLSSLGDRPVRVTDDVPTDEWTAASRSDRL